MSNPERDRTRVAILGATGCVGEALLRLLEHRKDLEFILAARHGDAAVRMASQSIAACSGVAADASNAASLDAIWREQPDILLNCSGRFRWTGMTVAQATIENGVDLIDIGDEPQYVDEVLRLDSDAKARGCLAVIGSGTAPQATGALTQLALSHLEHPADVTVGACFGMNRVGPVAVRTALEALSGLISVASCPSIWEPLEMVPFRTPFAPVWLRSYPLPETVYLPLMTSVRSWKTGAAFPNEWQNRLAWFLRRSGFARTAATTWMARPLTSILAAFETWMAEREQGKIGIELYIHARRDGREVEAHLYHPNMTDLTVQALVITLNWLVAKREKPFTGVRLAQDCMNPKEFLEELRTLGARWDIADFGPDRVTSAQQH